MSTALLLAGVLMMQTGPALTVFGSANRTEGERVDVAYDDVRQGRNEAAVVRIKGNRDLESDDPAAMINMGTAYARMGRTTEAKECFTRAMVSRERYELELADGSWMDSRKAARKANALLGTQGTLALATP